MREHGVDGLMFGGDWPDCEGYFRPYEGYRELVGELRADDAEKLYGGNLKALMAA